MRYRGPDDDGYHLDGQIAVGMRRLSIIDLAGGKQPIYSEDGGLVVVQNGEIYNFQELRRDLERRGHRFATRSDTEVIVHLYEELGTSFVDELNGMFAIAVWDVPRRRLVLARDRLGEKPLFYSEIGDSGVVFGSEIKCLLEHPAVCRDLDPQAIYNYFTLGYIPAPRTIYSQICKLPAGCRLVWENGRCRVDRYWEIPRVIDRAADREVALEQLRDLLADAVRIRTVSEVPVGAFLSGGVDSSLIVALMAEQSSSPVRTFFVDFAEEAYSERRFARVVAERYGTEHHEFVVRPDAVAILDDVVRHFDEPFGDASALPTWYVSQLTRQHVTVALSGDGGDESFGGYSRYRRILRRRDSPLLRRGLGPLLRRLASAMPSRMPGKRTMLACGLSNAEYYVAGSNELEAHRFLHQDLLQRVHSSVRDDLEFHVAERNGWNDRLAPYSDFDLHWYLPDDILVKVDRMSMAHSLEVRAPFLDPRVVSLAAQVPVEWKLTPSDSKVILKEAFAAYLPPEVKASRKRGFSMPLDVWLSGDLRPIIEDALADHTLEQAGILDLAQMQSLAHEHWRGVRSRASQLWWFLAFARWWHVCGGHGGGMLLHQGSISS